MDQNQIDKFLDEMIDAAELDIEVVFALRLKDIIHQVAGMYTKNQTGKVLTYADMTKYNKLTKELALISEKIHDLFSLLYGQVDALMQTQYLENYFRSAYLYEFEAQQKMGYGAINETVLATAIANPIPGLTLDALLEANRNDTIRRINIEITQGLIAGEDYSKMAKRIESTLNFSTVKAKRVARTEAHRCQVQGRIDSANQAAKYVDMTKMWDSTLDRKTREWHQKLDGKVVGKDEDFVTDKGKGPAPGKMNNAADDINCRCTVLFLVDGRKPSVRRERLEDGKTAIIPYTTYEDWYKRRIK